MALSGEVVALIEEFHSLPPGFQSSQKRAPLSVLLDGEFLVTGLAIPDRPLGIPIGAAIDPPTACLLDIDPHNPRDP
jgi:hypothetical protein